MNRIFKYEIMPNEHCISLPVGSTILSVGAQGDQIYVWSSVPETSECQDWYVEIVPTGQIHQPWDNDSFRGTVHMHNGQLVFHVFIEKKKVNF